MYQNGDLVCYGGTGVCRVDGIVMDRFRPTEPEQEYYVLLPLYQTGSILIPVNSDKVTIRPVISRQEALALIDSIPQIDAEPCNNKNIQQLENYYRTQMKGYDCLSLLRITMSAYRKKVERESARQKFGAVDRRYMERAQNLLFGELAVALGITPDEVQPFIKSRIEAAEV